MAMIVTVNDIINSNDNVDVTIHGVDKKNLRSPVFKEYFVGKVRDIPEYLRSCEVLNTGWLMEKQIHCIEIPYIETESKNNV